MENKKIIQTMEIYANARDTIPLLSKGEIFENFDYIVKSLGNYKKEIPLEIRQKLRYNKSINYQTESLKSAVEAEWLVGWEKELIKKNQEKLEFILGSFNLS